MPRVSNVDIAPTIAGLLGVEVFAAVDGEPLPIAPLALTTAASRKTHGSAGTFDLSLPIDGTLGIECRKSDSEEQSHQILLEFNKPIQAAHFSKVEESVDDNIVTLQLEDVRDGEIIELNGRVTDIYGGKLRVNFRVGFLRGDVDGDGIVTHKDVRFVEDLASKGKGTLVNSTNFQADINVDGRINNADVAQTQARVGRHFQTRQ